MPQRHKDIAQGEAADGGGGQPEGLLDLADDVQGRSSSRQLAQIIQSSVKAIGIKMKLKILTATAYFAGTQLGPAARAGATTPWLNTPMNITDWGGRAIPNVYLTVGARSRRASGTPRTTRTRSSTRSSKSYIAAISLKDQRKYAKQIEPMLLHDTPAIFPYFYYQLGGVSKTVAELPCRPAGRRST